MCICGAGKRRLRVELLLPEDGSSPFEGDGWPGGVKQQFAAVRPMVEATLMQLKQLPEFAVGIIIRSVVILWVSCLAPFLEQQVWVKHKLQYTAVVRPMVQLQSCSSTPSEALG